MDADSAVKAGVPTSPTEPLSGVQAVWIFFDQSLLTGFSPEFEFAYEL